MKTYEYIAEGITKKDGSRLAAAAESFNTHEGFHHFVEICCRKAGVEYDRETVDELLDDGEALPAEAKYWD